AASPRHFPGLLLLPLSWSRPESARSVPRSSRLRADRDVLRPPRSERLRSELRHHAAGSLRADGAAGHGAAETVHLHARRTESRGGVDEMASAKLEANKRALERILRAYSESGLERVVSAFDENGAWMVHTLPGHYRFGGPRRGHLGMAEVWAMIATYFTMERY